MEHRLRHGQPTVLELGPFQDLVFEEGPGTREADLAEADRSPEEGLIWLVQRASFPEPKALHVWAQVTRPGGQPERHMLVLLCQGGASGTGR